MTGRLSDTERNFYIVLEFRTKRQLDSAHVLGKVSGNFLKTSVQKEVNNWEDERLSLVFQFLFKQCTK